MKRRYIITNRRRRGAGRSRQIPQISSNITLNHTYRFETDGAKDRTISVRDLLLAAGTVCITSNSVVNSIFDSVKVNSIEMWSATSIGSIATVSCEWNSATSLGDTTREFSDSSITTSPAHIFTRPPIGSAASFWQNSLTNNDLFRLKCTAKCLVDVNLTLVMCDGTSSDAALAVTSATLSVVYFAALDGATDDFTPVSLTTVT